MPYPLRWSNVAMIQWKIHHLYLDGAPSKTSIYQWFPMFLSLSLTLQLLRLIFWGYPSNVGMYPSKLMVWLGRTIANLELTIKQTWLNYTRTGLYSVCVNIYISIYLSLSLCMYMYICISVSKLMGPKIQAGRGYNGTLLFEEQNPVKFLGFMWYQDCCAC